MSAKIRWARDAFNACEHRWDAREGETIDYTDHKTGEKYTEPARGPHRCIKDAGHETDPTNDDHQCCCGNTSG